MSVAPAIGYLPLSAGRNMVRWEPCAELADASPQTLRIKFPQGRPPRIDGRRSLMAFLAALVLLALPAGAATRCRAIDGDTLQCGRDRVRLQSVYAAERNEPGGSSARRNLQQRIDAGEVRIRKRGRDRYGRVVADVYVNGRRVEQNDVGPRGGRGAPRGSAEGVHAPVRAARPHATVPRAPKAAKKHVTQRSPGVRTPSRKTK